MATAGAYAELEAEVAVEVRSPAPCLFARVDLVGLNTSTLGEVAEFSCLKKKG